MKVRPILFSDEMVRAILAGRKTQTRRALKNQGYLRNIDHSHYGPVTARAAKEPGLIMFDANNRQTVFSALFPYGKIGDRLWVRETWAAHTFQNRFKPSELPAGSPIFYRADPEINQSHYWWRPSIHMPRWASRITLEIKDFRVEQVKEISEEDARQEGVEQIEGTNLWKCYDDCDVHHKGYDKRSSATASFMSLWNKINEKRGLGWDANPWVWVITFEMVEEKTV